MTTSPITYRDPATDYANPAAVAATIALADRFPAVYRDALAAIERQTAAAPDATEAYDVAALGIGSHFTDLLTAEDAPAWATDPDERRAYTYAVARTITARVMARQRANERVTLSLDALAADGDAYDTQTAYGLAKTDPARPDACTRQTVADTVGGIAARVDATPEGSKERVALDLIARADQAARDWQPARNDQRGRRPTHYGALGLALGFQPNSAESHRLRRVYLAAVALLEPLARDAYRDAWHVGTKATAERPRGWQPADAHRAARGWHAATATADQAATLSGYDLTRGARSETAPHPSPAVVFTTDDHGRRYEVRDAAGTLLAWDRATDGDLAALTQRAAAWLTTTDPTRPANPYGDSDARREARRAEQSPHVGLDRAPAVDRSQESRSHKAPSPRKRKASGQTGPTVPAGPHRPL